MKLLADYLDKLHISYDDEILRKFELYYSLLLEYNAKFNLTSITEKNDVIIKHFADSLYGYQLFKDNNSVADVGAGAGFPSIPLAIVLPNTDFTLIDSLNKRVGFLNVVIQSLGLKNASAVHSRVEDFCAKHRHSFDVATARAVAPLPTLLEYLVPLLKVGGKAVCYKSIGVDEEILASKNAFSLLNCELASRQDYELSDNQRSLIVVKSNALCNKCYPRGGNKPKLKPL